MSEISTDRDAAMNKVIEVNRSDLPLHCPMPKSSLWNSHPRVVLPIEATGDAKCPYCGAKYKLVL